MKLIRYILLFIVAFQSHAQVSDFETINFQKADYNALVCKNEGLNNLPELAYKLTYNLDSDAERFRAIYLWVCANVKNDYGLFLKNRGKRRKFSNDSLKLDAWNNHFKKRVFRKLLKNKKTLCTGYAYLVKELSSLANLDCKIIHGYSRTSTTDIEKLNAPNHSWNAVKLDGKWYLSDPTWASGIVNEETYEFKFQYNDGYFLASPNLFAINHFPVDKKWTLLNDEAPTFETFLEAPIVYGNAFKNLTLHDAPKKMHNIIQKHDKVTFKYQLTKTVTTDKISLVIDSGFTNSKIQPETITIKDKALTLEHQFNKTGFYDVHLFIGLDLISTYTFRVKS